MNRITQSIHGSTYLIALIIYNATLDQFKHTQGSLAGISLHRFTQSGTSSREGFPPVDLNAGRNGLRKHRPMQGSQPTIRHTWRLFIICSSVMSTLRAMFCYI